MKAKIYLLFGLFLMCSAWTYAQCYGVEAGNNKTIVCGDSINLFGQPKWSGGLDQWNNTFQGVFFTDSITGYVVGEHGEIRKTIDGGTNWFSQTSGVAVGLTSVFFTDSNTGYIAGEQGTILKTVNAGTNWIRQTSNTTADFLFSINFTNANTGVAVGSNGTILKTTDGGANWVPKTSNTTTSLTSVHFANSTVGYIAGNGRVLKTVDGGETWTTVLNSGSFYTIYFTSIDIGYLSCNLSIGNNTILKTTNGGVSWTDLNLHAPYGFAALFFVNANTGYAGSVGKIYKTENAGTSWASQGVPMMGIYGIHFPTPKRGYAVGYGTGGMPIKTTLKYILPDEVSWTPSTGLSSTTIYSPIASPAKTTTYKITTKTGTCIETDTITVTVDVLTANALGHDKGIVCGGSVQLDSVITNHSGTAPLTYSWSPSTGLSSTTIANPKANPSITTTYTVTIKTGALCTAIDTVRVTVYPLAIDAIQNKTITCGAAVQLDKIVTNYTGLGILKYSWSPSTGLNASNIANPIASPTQTTNYQITVTTPEGCAATDSVIVFVDSLKAFAGSDKSHVCGGSVELGPVGSNYTGTAPLLYTWLPIKGLNQTTVANPISNEAGVTYTVTITTPNGCHASDQVKADLKNMNAPSICMVGVDSTNKNVIRWNNFSSNAIDSVFVYKETSVSGNFVKIGSIVATKNGFRDVTSQPEVKSNKYKISILDTCGLESSKSLPHKTMHLAITKGVGSSWNLIWESYEGFTVPTYNIYRGTDASNLQLIDATSGTSNQFTNYNPPPVDLYYQVEVVNPAPCDPSNVARALRSNVASSKYVGIFEQEKNMFSFSVYPNPASEMLTITIYRANNKNMTLNIYNALGALVKTQSIEQNTQQLNVSDLINGFYIVELKTANGTSKQKLTIQK